MNNRSVIVSTALVASLVLSLLLYLFIPQSSQRRLLRFPDTAGGAVHSEWHYLPARDSRRDQIELFIEELKLGPLRLGAVPFIPRHSEIRSVVITDDRRLFVDFDPSVMFAEENVEDLIDLLEYNLSHNFRWLRDITITINGQELNVPRFANLGR